jgi:hypothetical protein
MAPAYVPNAGDIVWMYTELACGEVFQGTEAGVEFGGREAAQAVESAQKIPGGTAASEKEKAPNRVGA